MFFFWLSVREDKEKRVPHLQEQGFNVEITDNKKILFQRLESLNSEPAIVFLNINAVNFAIEVCHHIATIKDHFIDVVLCPEFITPEHREHFITEGGQEILLEPVGKTELSTRFKRWKQEKENLILCKRELANTTSMLMSSMESGAETGVALNFCRRILASGNHDSIAEVCLEIVTQYGEGCCIEMFDGFELRYYFSGSSGEDQKTSLKNTRKHGRILLNEDLQINQSHLAIRISNLTKIASEKFQESTDNFSILMDLANKFVLKANQSLKQSQLEKNHHDFLDNIGSELQTRLNVMLKFATAMHKLPIGHTLVDKHIQGLRSTYVNSVRLKKIIDAMSDLVRVSSGADDLNYQDVHIPELFNRLKEVHAPIAQQQSDTTVLLGKVADVTLKSGEVYLSRILSYLIDRAIECTKHGKIILNCINKDLPEKTVIVLQVVDTGKNLSESQIEKIIQADFKPSEDNADKFDINMVYVRTFSTLLGGELHIFSEPEKGTTMSITFIIDNNPVHEAVETQGSGIELF